ncbi:PREDICTED: uncharacterized protein LOC106740584 isoform X2 [Dinoponera quadriceps]|uniref:Uncharacterized protein LOC106740584 isoform X2 n=1 Tax=Dinoponera quadriceps TaxID=609295 RepID=A0A6P3WME6_DINQU|nr:PREDICTED: uncharacterized protein LOC106740584 isoform X2 [Dinoponera quadriceps]
MIVTYNDPSSILDDANYTMNTYDIGRGSSRYYEKHACRHLQLKTCLKTIENDWSSLNTDTEKAILQRHASYAQHITTSYAVFMQLTGILLIFKSSMTLLFEDTTNTTLPIIVAESKLPFRVEYGEKMRQCLFPVAIHCYLAVFAHSNITIAVDSLYITLVHHACGMFKIVGITDEDYGKALSCLRRHLHVIEFAELIEATFTNIFLVGVCLNMIGGSMIGIQVVLNLDDAKDVVEPLTIYIAQLFHLFLQFWQGQFLLTYSAVPYESICRANWYYTSGRCRKILLLIMNRTVLPCKLTAGKIVILSIETFGVVNQTALLLSIFLL